MLIRRIALASLLWLGGCEIYLAVEGANLLARLAIDALSDDSSATPAADATTATALKASSEHANCVLALTGGRDAWDIKSSYAAHVAEAKKRSLSVAECRRIVGG